MKGIRLYRNDQEYGNGRDNEFTEEKFYKYFNEDFNKDLTDTYNTFSDDIKCELSLETFINDEFNGVLFNIIGIKNEAVTFEYNNNVYTFDIKDDVRNN